MLAGKGAILGEIFTMNAKTWYKRAGEVSRDPENPNCSPELLAEVVRRGKNDWVSWSAVNNPNCPPEALAEVLRKGKDDGVSRNAAENPNCLPEALAEVLRRGKDMVSWYAAEVSWYAARNPNCPPEALAEVLRRGKNDGVSRYAAENPNCPIREKFLWLMLTHKNDFVFLNFLDKEYLEIRGDEEIREFVKDKLLAYIFKTYKPLSSILGDQGDQVRKLLDEFSNDFEISILIEEIDEQVEKNKL